MRSSTNGALTVKVGAGGAGDILRMPYPPVAGDLTAGEWNRAAIANNRIEIRVR